VCACKQAEEDEETALAAGEMEDEGGDLFAEEEEAPIGADASQEVSKSLERAADLAICRSCKETPASLTRWGGGDKAAKKESKATQRYPPCNSSIASLVAFLSTKGLLCKLFPASCIDKERVPVHLPLCIFITVYK
jgi:hypothetical protein